jgi:hypothetical protein
MKRIFNTVDLSSQIFSPNIHLSRQILKRIWMDTWSALLLCHTSTRMDPDKSVAFSAIAEAPPSLLLFEGSLAERHVENLKIMRTAGAKRYIEACRELTAEETILRQKVYNFYCGPGNTPI